MRATCRVQPELVLLIAARSIVLLPLLSPTIQSNNALNLQLPSAQVKGKD